jgi:hypothetical protein
MVRTRARVVCAPMQISDGGKIVFERKDFA